LAQGGLAPTLGPRRRMAAAVTSGETLCDITGQLERAAEAGRRASELRPTRGPRIPHTEDEFRPTWKQPPAKEDVRRVLAADRARHFARFGKHAGGDFSTPKRLAPVILDPWTQDRLISPDRRFAKSASTIRYHAHSEPFGQPHDSLCHGLHQEWLRKHYVARDRHVHSVYHALQAVDRAAEKLESHTQKRQLARDLLTRQSSMDLPQFSDGVKKSLNKVRKAVASSRAFHKAANIDRLAEDESNDQAKLEHAKSAPALCLRPPTPEGRASHLRRWAGPEHSLKYLRESTPWREQDEGRALAARAQEQSR